MNFKPDFVYTITGYRWLDKLTSPFWDWRIKRQERKFYRIAGDGNEERGERILKRAFNIEMDGFPEMVEAKIDEYRGPTHLFSVKGGDCEYCGVKPWQSDRPCVELTENGH